MHHWVPTISTFGDKAFTHTAGSKGCLRQLWILDIFRSKSAKLPHQTLHIKWQEAVPLISICDYNVALIRLVPLCSPLSNIKLMVLATMQRAQMLRQSGTRAGSDLQVHLVVNSRSIQHLLPVQECPLFHSHLIQFVYDNTVSVNNMHLKFEMVLSSRPHPQDSAQQLRVL